MDSIVNLNQEEQNYIKTSVKNRQSVFFSCNVLSQDEKEKFKERLRLFLKSCNQENLYNYLSYCLLELLDNANRANVKRIYFQKNNLDITDISDYKKGMKDFKKIISDSENDFSNDLKASELVVKLTLSANDDILMQVANNTKITEIELDRLNEKIDKTKQYNTIQDAVNDIDQTEGCGLGIISIILMLKNITKKAQCLFFNLTDSSTVATIQVPVNNFTQLEEI